MKSPESNLVAELGRKYIWWEPVEGNAHSSDRIVAQVMNLGVYDDILRLEAALPPEELAAVMRRAAAGWFSARSWEFWRGRLSVEGQVVPAAPPLRSFHAAEP